MSTTVTAIPGDCPDTFRRVQALLRAARAPITWDEVPADAGLDAQLQSVARTKHALVGHTRWRGTGLSPAVALREKAGVFAQHRPIRPLPGLRTRHDDVDLLLIRETTEDVYAHLEHESAEGVFESLKVTTRAACERIARHAFDTARRLGRSKVTVVHKSNIMKLSDGMFLRTAQEVAKAYPDLVCDEVIVDALCMKLVVDPSRFDVLLSGNLYGDIVGDLCAGLVGGASNAPSVNFGRDGAVWFTAGHGDPAELDGTEAANVLPVLLPAVHLLHHLRADGEAGALVRGIASALESGVVPRALGGTASADAFCAHVERSVTAR